MAKTTTLGRTTTIHNNTKKDIQARGQLLTLELTPRVKDRRVIVDLARKVIEIYYIEILILLAKLATNIDILKNSLDNIQ